jgi:acyl dehydratase
MTATADKLGGTVTTREKLHRVIDDLPEADLDTALELLVSKSTDAPGEPQEIVVDAEYAERALDAFEHPERFEAGLRRLMASAGKRTLERD